MYIQRSLSKLHNFSLIRLMWWGGRLFLKGDRSLDLFCFTKLLTGWHKCPSKVSLSRRITVLEDNTT